MPTRVIITGGDLDTSASQAPAQSRQSFVRRLIEVTVTLTPNQQTGQPNTFAGTESNQVTFSGFRTSVKIQNAGGVNNRASVVIYGMNPTTMNQLSTLGMIFDMVQKNSITISAGDAQSGLTPVFSGTIANAYGNYQNLPAASMCFECQVGLINAVLPVPASSFPQPTDVATIMAGFAAQLNSAAGHAAGFENNGVTVQLPASYYSGSLLDQIKAVAHDAHINAEILPGSGGQDVLAIWPIGGSRTSLTQNIPLVNKDTGMILTPSFAPNGYALVRNLFNPLISFGGVIHLESKVIPQLTRDWVVYQMALELESYTPKGKWEQILACYPKGFAAPVPPSV